MWTLVWCTTLLFNGHDGKEPTDRLIPPGWVGNPWGPAATQARASGALPPIPMTPLMQQWDKWGKQVLRDGDILFRRGDARVLFGRFPFSRFIANASGSPYSHTAIASIEGGEVFTYDITKAGARRQPFAVWVLDNVGSFGVKRVRPELRSHASEAVRFCRRMFEEQVPFDFALELDDKALYCVEMTEKAYRSSGLVLSEPVRLGDMENAPQFPICMFMFQKLSTLTLEQAVYFPGNDRHGIWSCPSLTTVYPPPPASASGARPAHQKRAVSGEKPGDRPGARPT
jgi:hypothetical protein